MDYEKSKTIVCHLRNFKGKIERMNKKNDLVTVDVVGMTHEGSGIGRLPDGMAIFIPASAVGDRLQARILKVNKNYAYGKVEKILVPSQDRTPSDCPVSRRCGGCVFRHVSYEAELRYKQEFIESNLRRIGKLDLQIEKIQPSPLQSHYRNKAQYPVRMQKGKMAAGFFAPRTHEVIDCRTCGLQPVYFTDILQTILSFAEKNNISIYDETTGKGLLRHIYLRGGYHTGEVMVCLVINGDGIEKRQALVQGLLACCPQIVSVILNLNKEKTNVILGKENKVIYGKEYITDLLCGLQFELSPHSFYQVNTPGAEKLYEIAGEYAGLTGGETLMDLYCGAGTIGLSLAGKCARVIGVEIVSQAVENAKKNAKNNGIDNAEFLCADAALAAERMEKEGIRPDVVVLDPPRKGCDQKTLQAVAKMSPERIVMISCNSATAARDCEVLENLGYQAIRCRPVDMFPKTAHCEVCIQLCRKQNSLEQ
ncbi:23S rRNA (uracil(1939)-C(5))-methyltransferase RlmD [Youxingia wuxianensis]|nr:23S rRNA (uracil(1939)-C(5))-methyltransferase RlmD [Youxingia wuxianensis]